MKSLFCSLTAGVQRFSLIQILGTQTRCYLIQLKPNHNSFFVSLDWLEFESKACLTCWNENLKNHQHHKHELCPLQRTCNCLTTELKPKICPNDPLNSDNWLSIFLHPNTSAKMSHMVACCAYRCCDWSGITEPHEGFLENWKCDVPVASLQHF